MYSYSGGLDLIISALSVVVSIVTLITVLVSLVCNWRLFTKAGTPGWWSLIPLFNVFVMIRLAGLPKYYIFLFFIPYVKFPAIAYFGYRFLRAYQVGIGMYILYLLMPWALYPYIAFSNKFEYVGAC